MEAMRGLRKQPDRACSSQGEGSPFAVRTGLKLVSADPGRATATLRVQRDGLTDEATVDSDTISALVQATAAAATAGPSGRRDLSDIYITFVQPAPEHPLTAEARVVRQEGYLHSCEVEVRDWDGALVAKALLSYRF
jgi:acyl-coenzyme A thioesterase PaaI-like protein